MHTRELLTQTKFRIGIVQHGIHTNGGRLVGGLAVDVIVVGRIACLRELYILHMEP